MERTFPGLRAKRKARRLSRQDVAVKINAAEVSVGRWERGEPIRCKAHYAALVKLLGKPEEAAT